MVGCRKCHKCKAIQKEGEMLPVAVFHSHHIGGVPVRDTLYKPGCKACYAWNDRDRVAVERQRPGMTLNEVFAVGAADESGEEVFAVGQHEPGPDDGEPLRRPDGRVFRLW